MRYTIPISAMTNFDRGLPWKVDPRLPELYELPAWARRALDEYRPSPEPHAPQDDSRAVRFQDDAFFIVPPTPITAGRWYPVAEFVVPAGHYGWIYRIDTHIGINDIAYNDDDDPLAVWRATNANSVYWRMMIQSPGRQRAQAHNWISIAGVPVPGFSSWSDGRYSWGNQSGKISILVPENRVVRLYAGLNPAIDPVPTELGGRLVGVTATYDLNPQAIDLLRTAS